MTSTIDRVLKKANDEGLSIRKIGMQSGVSFSTIARAIRHRDVVPEPETDQKLRAWLGDDLSDEVPCEVKRKIEAISRTMARSFASELFAAWKEQKP